MNAQQVLSMLIMLTMLNGIAIYFIAYDKPDIFTVFVLFVDMIYIGILSYERGVSDEKI